MRRTEDISFQYENKEKEPVIESKVIEEVVNNDKNTKKFRRVKEKKGPWEIVYEWLDSFVFSIILIVIVFVFGFRVVGVDGESMMPTLNDGDWLAVQAITPTIERGDIVIITQPNITNEPLIKRVIAVGGDTLKIDFTTGKVEVNGEVIDEPYIMAPTQIAGDFKKPVRIPEGYVFVMGDNRNQSLDSRFNTIGVIDERYILGVANVRLFPYGEWEIENNG